MTTAAAIIRQALAHIRVRGAGQSVSGDDAADALAVLNTMLDSWRLDELNAVATTILTGTLLAGTQSITIGPTGQTITSDPRPIRIEAGSFVTTSDGLDYSLMPVTEAEFNEVWQKQVSGLVPYVFHYRPSYPNATLRFFPLGTANLTLSLVALVQVPGFATLTTDYSLAPGYERAIVFSLAEELAGVFEAPVPASVARIAMQARALMKRVNHLAPQLETERGDHSGEWRRILFPFY